MGICNSRNSTNNQDKSGSARECGHHTKENDEISSNYNIHIYASSNGCQQKLTPNCSPLKLESRSTPGSLTSGRIISLSSNLPVFKSPYAHATAVHIHHNNNINNNNNNYSGETEADGSPGIGTLDSKYLRRRMRVVFISFQQLNACIDNIPDFILQESIFCFKAKRIWFFPSNFNEHMHAKLSIVAEMPPFNPKFWQWLQTKDEQGLILWFSEKKTWNDISSELQRIRDPYQPPPPSPPTISALPASPAIVVSNNLNQNGNRLLLPSKVRKTLAGVQEVEVDGSLDKDTTTNINTPPPENVFAIPADNEEVEEIVRFYKPLKLNVAWWMYNYGQKVGCQSCFNADVNSVITEIKSGQGNAISTMELLFQSNPTMIPMFKFSWDEYQRFQEWVNQLQQQQQQEIGFELDDDIDIDDENVDVPHHVTRESVSAYSGYDNIPRLDYNGNDILDNNNNNNNNNTIIIDNNIENNIVEQSESHSTSMSGSEAQFPSEQHANHDSLEMIEVPDYRNSETFDDKEMEQMMRRMLRGHTPSYNFATTERETTKSSLTTASTELRTAFSEEFTSIGSK